MDFNIYHVIALLLFLGGYIIITFEHTLKTQKAPIALLLGVALWILVPLSGNNNSEYLSHDLEVAAAETFGIFMFLFTAMILIEVLVHYKFFDWIRKTLYNLGLQDRGQFVVFCVITFFGSAILDNLTITLVMINIARRFFRGRNLIITAAAIVINANAGGAWSPIGDVTTIMLWLAEKFTAGQIVQNVFLPSLVHSVIASKILMGKLISTNIADSEEDLSVSFTASELVVIALTLGSFALPLAVSQIGLQPYMGLLAGLGIVWALTGYLKASGNRTHLEADITEMTRKVDVPSLQFFVGILLSVGALSSMGLLGMISNFLFGTSPDILRISVGNIFLGYLSAIMDNVPLTALAMDVVPTDNPTLWTLLAYCVGTGGSHLVIGSAAGVVAMGLIKELNSLTYLQIATKAVAAAYLGGIAAFGLQQLIKSLF